MTQSTVRLSKEELRDLTGYEQPSKQLAELHRRGFHRAYIGRHGLVLERAHYEAVCQGATEKAVGIRSATGDRVYPLTSRRSAPATINPRGS